MTYIPHRQVMWSHPAFFSTITLQPATRTLSPPKVVKVTISNSLGLGHRIHLLVPASSSNAASSQSCGASTLTSREQSRHQTHLQACIHTKSLERLYSDSSKRFGLVHLQRQVVREREIGHEGYWGKAKDIPWTSSRDDELGQLKVDPLIQIGLCEIKLIH